MTIENQTNTTDNNTTGNDTSKTSTTKTSKKSSSSSSYGEGSYAVDANGNIRDPPDDSGNWVLQGGRWKHAVTYKNGHYYDYHGDIVDHKMNR